MTAEEYKVKLTQAISDSITKRWEPRAEEGIDVEVIYCPLCFLDMGVRRDNSASSLRCCTCPLNTPLVLCSIGYNQWMRATIISEYKAAAKIVLAELRGIDVDAWTEKLVKKGWLE